MSKAEFAGVIAAPCPFCGEDETTLAYDKHNQADMWYVRCLNTDCFCQGPMDLGKSGALAKWNELDLRDNRRNSNPIVKE